MTCGESASSSLTLSVERSWTASWLPRAGFDSLELASDIAVLCRARGLVASPSIEEDGCRRVGKGATPPYNPHLACISFIKELINSFA